MHGKSWRVGAVAALFALAALGVLRADDKPTDEGKAEDFKGKSFDLKEKTKAAIILTFASGKEALLTVRCDKKSDVNLFVYDEEKKVVAKDDSPGPDCDIKFTPKKSGKYTVEVVNAGPGDNKCNLTVAFAKKDKDK
jgi:hypothetical protein